LSVPDDKHVGHAARVPMPAGAARAG
jgi:hypothetical protein